MKIIAKVVNTKSKSYKRKGLILSYLTIPSSSFTKLVEPHAILLDLATGELFHEPISDLNCGALDGDDCIVTNEELLEKIDTDKFI